MFKKIFIPSVLLLTAYGIFSNNDFKIIASGIAIFIVGMVFMEEGFKLFTGGTLEKILKKTTDTVVKAIISGFVSTSLVQSSSLTSIIAISFLSAELIALSQALGIIFGANIGTTTTAWIVSAFGMKIKISAYAMPMLIFGVILTFLQNKSAKGVGNILLGLGFIFLGIGYMKEGFETLKSGIDLAQFAMEGYAGIFVYILVGAIATVIIQSSSATMAIIITAVATGQISYMNSLSLAIGANVGTTVTAILGALTSNADGKRLAVGHLIFNTITAVFAVAFIHVLSNLVNVLSGYIGIGDEDIAMKLSLFHTIFNVIGVLLVAPFISPMVTFLQKLFVSKANRRGNPIYIGIEVSKMPGPAIAALRKETEHLYDSVSHLVVQALRLHRHEVWSLKEMREVMETVKGESVDVDVVYNERIKFLYSEMLHFAVMAENHMDGKEKFRLERLKLASRDLVEITKDLEELQKNISRYMKGNNQALQKEYNALRERIASIVRDIDRIRQNPDDLTCLTHIELSRSQVDTFDNEITRKISDLLRDDKIDVFMASSLMNDSSFTRSISRRLLDVAAVLWIQDETIRELQDYSGE
ncbi:Na/Pi cotransporter family protein [Desulforhopalus sp. 52FAK]